MRLYQPKHSVPSLAATQKPIHASVPKPELSYDSSRLSQKAILQLQQTIGNQAVMRLLKQPNPGADKLQRMVVVARPSIGAITDFVELTSIDYALKQAGGPVVGMSNPDFRGLSEGDTVYIVGHGREGEAGDYDADEIAATLTDPTTGLPADTHINVIFTSCYAGVGVDSVVSTLLIGT